MHCAFRKTKTTKQRSLPRRVCRMKPAKELDAASQTIVKKVQDYTITWLDFSVQPLCALCPVVETSRSKLTTETQSTQRLHREEFKLGHCFPTCKVRRLTST